MRGCRTRARDRQKRRKQVGLSRAGIAEHADVGVGIPRLIERVDKDGSTARVIAAHDEATRLLNLRTTPREERCQRAGVEDTLAGQAVDACGKCREVAIEHPERARLELTKRGASRGANLFGTLLQGLLRGRDQGDVDGDVKRLLLA